MNVRALAATLLLLTPACVTAPTTDPVRLPSGEWRLDERHASVIWRVRHLGLSWYAGRFDGLEASLDFDPARPEDARLVAIIDAASLSTGDAAFDDILRGPAWFAADAHPQIVFESETVEITGENRVRVTGRLTMKGRTREAAMDIHFYGGNFNFLEGRDAIGFRGDMRVDRTEFGIGLLPAAIAGREIRIRIEAEFLRED